MNIITEIINCPHCGKPATYYSGHVMGLEVNGCGEISVIYGACCQEHFELPSPLQKLAIYSGQSGYKGQWCEKLGLRIVTTSYTEQGKIENSLEHIVKEKEKVYIYLARFVGQHHHKYYIVDTQQGQYSSLLTKYLHTDKQWYYNTKNKGEFTGYWNSLEQIQAVLGNDYELVIQDKTKIYVKCSSHKGNKFYQKYYIADKKEMGLNNKYLHKDGTWHNMTAIGGAFTGYYDSIDQITNLFADKYEIVIVKD